MSEPDPNEEIAALNARGRKKAIRRAIKTFVAIAPAAVLWIVLMPLVGWLPGLVVAVVIGAVSTVALEKLFPGDDPTIED